MKWLSMREWINDSVFGAQRGWEPLFGVFGEHRDEKDFGDQAPSVEWPA